MTISDLIKYTIGYSKNYDCLIVNWSIYIKHEYVMRTLPISVILGYKIILRNVLFEKIKILYSTYIIHPWVID